jgi:uracil-DNA glycosylase
MYAAVISPDADEIEFRELARRCLTIGLSSSEVAFVAPDEPALLPALPDSTREAPRITVPRGYIKMLRDAICHRASDRFALLYDVLWRISRGERDLVARASDPGIARLNEYALNVRRDIHKMHAFLRFRARSVDGEPFYAAWFEPQHFILQRAVPFFVDRFANMRWLIATPIGTAVWKDGILTYGPPASRPLATKDDVLDELWLTYYRATFNPTRLRVAAMTKEMPKHYWSSMPETSLIPELVERAGERVTAMAERRADQPSQFADRIANHRRSKIEQLPDTPLAELRTEASGCIRCPLHAAATQTVFGDGAEHARLIFVGEQPGDQEDLEGRPFVGPAGGVFDRALAEAGIAREGIYVTNAVKHFKYVPRGKRRIHAKPSGYEIERCRWWLERELAAIAPQLVVALGGTAAQSLAGRTVSVLRERGPIRFGPQDGFITVHPSFLLRLTDKRAREIEYARFVADLVAIRSIMAQATKANGSETAIGALLKR